MIPTAEIKHLLEKAIELTDFFLVDLVVRGDWRYRVIEVFIDSEKGVTADDCAKIGIEFQNNLQQLNLPWHYRLEVSSPGLDKKLKDIRQYKRHLGRNAKITFIENEIEKTVIGKLLEVKKSSVVIESEKKKTELTLKNIVSTLIQTKF